MDNQKHKKIIINSIKDIVLLNGFKKKSDTFLRELSNGIIQVIDFPLGPGWSMSNGNLSVGLGIYLDELYRLTNLPYPIKKITSSHCEIRDIYNNDLNFQSVKVNEAEKAIGEIAKYLNEKALPWFDKFNSIDSILNGWEKEGYDFGLPPRGRLSIASIIMKHGKIEKAEALIEQEKKENIGKPYYKYIIEVEEKLRNFC